MGIALFLASVAAGCSSNAEVVCEAYVECGIHDDLAECVADIEENQDVEICQDVIGYSVEHAGEGDCGRLRNEAAVWDEFAYCYP
ncbi:MAG: hypothetical protein DRJ42_27770 [Deltaproteobacteria bacterium]|nr:MAG: hypothetical protein DRJ42_27770 [Deltaproteobacteria bacterium]